MEEWASATVVMSGTGAVAGMAAGLEEVIGTVTADRELPGIRAVATGVGPVVPLLGRSGELAGAGVGIQPRVGAGVPPGDGAHPGGGMVCSSLEVSAL